MIETSGLAPNDRLKVIRDHLATLTEMGNDLFAGRPVRPEGRDSQYWLNQSAPWNDLAWLVDVCEKAIAVDDEKAIEGGQIVLDNLHLALLGEKP